MAGWKCCLPNYVLIRTKLFGKTVVAETPLPFGPRNCGQSSATALVDANMAINCANDKAKIVFFTFDIVLRE